jgi:hypothetical protein
MLVPRRCGWRALLAFGRLVEWTCTCTQYLRIFEFEKLSIQKLDAASGLKASMKTPYEY